MLNNLNWKCSFVLEIIGKWANFSLILCFRSGMCFLCLYCYLLYWCDVGFLTRTRNNCIFWNRDEMIIFFLLIENVQENVKKIFLKEIFFITWWLDFSSYYRITIVDQTASLHSLDNSFVISQVQYHIHEKLTFQFRYFPWIGTKILWLCRELLEKIVKIRQRFVYFEQFSIEII